MRTNHPRVAVSVWPGEHHDIARWLESSLVDAAIVYDMQPRAGWSMDVLSEDKLVQVATQRRPVVRWDPEYVYVDHGAEFRRQHAAAYPVEETATVTFGQSDWALRHILLHGGSGYLPLRQIREHITEGDLYEVEGAAVFSRTIHMVCNDASRRIWPWFDASLSELRARLDR